MDTYCPGSLSSLYILVHIQSVFTIISTSGWPVHVVLDNCNDLQQPLQKRPAYVRRALFPALSYHDYLIDLFCVLLSSSCALKQRYCLWNKKQKTICRHTLHNLHQKSNGESLNSLIVTFTNLELFVNLLKLLKLPQLFLGMFQGLKQIHTMSTGP